MVQGPNFDFRDTVKILGLGAMPWLNYLKPLRWHLRVANFNPVPVFNAVATICAALLSYLYYESENPLELWVPPVWWLLPLFIVPAAVYFTLFLAYRESVQKGIRKWPLLVAFLVYIGLFCSLAVVAGNLEIRRVFWIVRGQVINAEGKAGIEGARVDLVGEGEPVTYDTTNADGSFLLAVDRSAKLDEFLVNKTGFKEHSEKIRKRPKASYPVELEREVVEDEREAP